MLTLLSAGNAASVTARASSNRANSGVADKVLSVDVLPSGQTWVAVKVRCGSRSCIALADKPSTSAAFGLMTRTNVPAGEGGSLTCLGNCGASQVVFANPKDGYLFDPGMYSTDDGGAQWTQVIGGVVNSLVLNGSQVIRGVFAHTGCPGPCDEHLESSVPGSNSWHTISTAPRGMLDFQYGLDMATSGTGTAYALSLAHLAVGAGLAVLYRATDNGRTWAKIPNPCKGGFETYSVAAAEKRVAVLCAKLSRGALLLDLRISEDAGSSFGPLHRLPLHGGQLAMSNDALYVATGPLGGSGIAPFQVDRSTDDGLTWKTVLSGHEVINTRIGDNGVLVAGLNNGVYFVSNPASLWQSTYGRSWRRSNARIL